MGISPFQLIIVLILVALIFGTAKLRNLGSDLGGAIKGFKKELSDNSSTATETVNTELKTVDNDKNKTEA